MVSDFVFDPSPGITPPGELAERYGGSDDDLLSGMYTGESDPLGEIYMGHQSESYEEGESEDGSNPIYSNRIRSAL
jgi:hypothetical protein